MNAGLLEGERATFRHPLLPVKASTLFAKLAPSVHNAPPSPERP
jgi:hypothetical protein